MTRESFIRKWLANPQKQYNEQCRDEMRDDLDLVIQHSANTLVIGSVCEHTWFVTGLGNDYFKCSKCGKTKAN